jgi:ribosome-associated protein
VPIREESIRLGQFLKLADLAETGSDAKELILAGEVMVNGEPETRRGRQLRAGDVVESGGRPARVARRPGPAVVLAGEGAGARHQQWLPRRWPVARARRLRSDASRACGSVQSLRVRGGPPVGGEVMPSLRSSGSGDPRADCAVRVRLGTLQGPAEQGPAYPPTGRVIPGACPTSSVASTNAFRALRDSAIAPATLRARGREMAGSSGRSGVNCLERAVPPISAAGKLSPATRNDAHS